MTTEDEFELRACVLKWVYKKYPKPIGPKSIQFAMELLGLESLNDNELDQILRYLEVKKLIERDPESPERRLYLVTDTGRDWLDRRNLINQ